MGNTWYLFSVEVHIEYLFIFHVNFLFATMILVLNSDWYAVNWIMNRFGIVAHTSKTESTMHWNVYRKTEKIEELKKKEKNLIFPLFLKWKVQRDDPDNSIIIRWFSLRNTLNNFHFQSPYVCSHISAMTLIFLQCSM